MRVDGRCPSARYEAARTALTIGRQVIDDSMRGGYALAPADFGGLYAAAERGAAAMQLARNAAQGHPPCDHVHDPAWHARDARVVELNTPCSDATHVHPAHGNAPAQ